MTSAATTARRHDDARRALDGEVAQPEAHAGAQVLAAALERDEVVERHDLRARAGAAARRRSRRVEDVDAPRAVGLDDLVARRRGLAQRVEQAADVAADPARVGRRAGVERDPHRDPVAASRPRAAGSPRRGRRRRRRRSAARARARRRPSRRAGRALEHGGGERVRAAGLDEPRRSRRRRRPRRSPPTRVATTGVPAAIASASDGPERLLARGQRRARRGGA